MASYFGDYGAEKTLDYWLDTSETAATRPTSTIVKLHTGDPGADGTANEVSTGVWTNYSSQTMNNDGTTSPFWNKSVAEGGNRYRCDNNGALSFGTAAVTGGPATITHASVWDQAGNLLFYGALATSKPVSNGDPVVWASGDFDIKLKMAA